MLEQARAFRDIGGLTTRDGREVRRGRVFRSDALERLSACDQDTFRALGIRTVCDLRSEGERARHPNRLPEGHACEQVHFGIITDVRAGDARLFDALRRRPDAEGAREMMLDLYRGMPEAFVPHMGPLLRRIARGELPMVIHCTAGKDRTGFVVAMLLSLLDVERRDILDEYLLTTCEAPTPERLAYVRELLSLHLGHPAQAGVVERVLGAAAAYLEAALDTVETFHGSVDRYLRKACGLDSAELEAVRRAMLDA